MRLRKRGHEGASGGVDDGRAQPSGGGDGDSRGAALLGALGLGSFALLDLPPPPDGLDLAAKVDPASGCIVVSLDGDLFRASPVDLAASLALPVGPVSLAPEVDAALFSSAEAIATIRAFVHGRLLLGGGDGGPLPEEAFAALRLVDEGKAHSVDWGQLVWAVLKAEVALNGRPRCYAPHLLRLIECQRPHLFSQVNGTLRFGKRGKGLMQRQCQRTDGQSVDCREVEVAEQSMLHRDNRNDQAAEDEPDKSSSLQNVIFGSMSQHGSAQQHITETEDEGGDDENFDVGPPVISSDHFDRNIADFDSMREKMLAHISAMANSVQETEKDILDTKAAIFHLREKNMEKHNVIECMSEVILEEAQARHTEVCRFEQDKEAMQRTVQGLKKLLKESSAAFLEYRRNRRICGEGGGSSWDVLGIAME